jgi:hypothetical protein
MYTKVTPVRPYWSAIRDKIFNHIRLAGFTIDEADIIGINETDAELMSHLMTRQGHILLVPYNASSSNETSMKTGLDIIYAMNISMPDLCQSPIIMPVANAVANVLRSRLAEERENGRFTPEIDQQILFVSEADIDRPELAQRIRSHVENRVQANS